MEEGIGNTHNLRLDWLDWMVFHELVSKIDIKYGMMFEQIYVYNIKMYFRCYLLVCIKNVRLSVYLHMMGKKVMYVYGRMCMCRKCTCLLACIYNGNQSNPWVFVMTTCLWRKVSIILIMYCSLKNWNK